MENINVNVEPVEEEYKTISIPEVIKGKDGYTPIKGVDYFDGVNGTNGVNGYTPIKGVDYFDGKDGKDGSDYVLTEADKLEIVNTILNELPNAEEVSF